MTYAATSPYSKWGIGETSTGSSLENVLSAHARIFHPSRYAAPPSVPRTGVIRVSYQAPRVRCGVAMTRGGGDHRIGTFTLCGANDASQFWVARISRPADG